MILFKEFEAKTGGRLDALDISEEVAQVVEASGITNGTVLVFSPHTTCCVLLATPGPPTMAALENTMAALAPPDAYYAHDDLSIRTENLVEDEPANGPAHVFHALCGKVSECIPVIDGRVAPGDEQRVVFVELDSSRARRYCVQAVGE